MLRMTEADTCRQYVLPKLYAAGWDDERIAEQPGSRRLDGHWRRDREHTIAPRPAGVPAAIVPVEDEYKLLGPYLAAHVHVTRP
jgi:type I restriction enzyme R subunit